MRNNADKEQKFKHYAFISFSSHDTFLGQATSEKQKGHSPPTTLCNEREWERKPMCPVFFAPTDIQHGGLDEKLKNRLRAAKNLIIICSPYSAQSEWFGKEIEYFHGLERQNNIHFFIVEGKPHSDNKATECFNPVVDELNIPEILGANIYENIYRLLMYNLSPNCSALSLTLSGSVTNVLSLQLPVYKVSAAVPFEDKSSVYAELRRRCDAYNVN